MQETTLEGKELRVIGAVFWTSIFWNSLPFLKPPPFKLPNVLPMHDGIVSSFIFKSNGAARSRQRTKLAQDSLLSKLAASRA